MTTTMQAITFSEYGAPHVLCLTEMEKPTPKPNELLVRVHATTVSSGDGRSRRGEPFMVRFVTGIFKPNVILGSDFAGVVTAVGANVTRFKRGDQVFGSTGMAMGTNAQYICLSETGQVVRQPAHLTAAEAAAIPFGATTALAFLNKMGIQAGQKVLIYGASGSVGTAAVQLARYFGADVTAVCSSKNFELVRSLGAAKTIDYTQEDFTQCSDAFDAIFDAVGKTDFSQCKGLLKPNGLYASLGLSLKLCWEWVVAKIVGGKRMQLGVVNGTVDDLRFLKQLLEASDLQPTIDKRYSLEQIAEAHQHVDTGHKRGNVIVTMV